MKEWPGSSERLLSSKVVTKRKAGGRSPQQRSNTVKIARLDKQMLGYFLCRLAAHFEFIGQFRLEKVEKRRVAYCYAVW